MMADFFVTVAGILILALMAFIAVKVWQDMKRSEAEYKSFREMQRHFMAAGLAYFNSMNRYVCSITTDECVKQCPCDDD